MPRTARTRATPLPPKPVPLSSTTEEGRPDTALQARVETLIPRANAGDSAAAEALLAACRETPALWNMLAALAGHAERAWLRLLMGEHEDRVQREIVEQELRRKRRELSGPHPSPLEALLVERIVLCWVAATHAEAQYASKLKAGMSFRKGEYYARRGEQTQRQLLKAIKALARVRRLLTPLQVNIGQNQINVAG